MEVNEIYENFANLIEYIGRVKTPGQKWITIRILFDPGSTTNLISKRLVDRHGIDVTAFQEAKKVDVAGGLTTESTHKTSRPLDFRIGTIFRDRSNFTVMDLGESFDMLLGLPFYVNRVTQMQGYEVTVKTGHRGRTGSNRTTVLPSPIPSPATRGHYIISEKRVREGIARRRSVVRIAHD